VGYVHAGVGAPPLGTMTGEVNSVIVVGAGAAGLTVGNALTGAGVPTVVLEARDRVGGRIHTVELGSVPVDLGASWIHNPQDNPLSDLASSLGVAQVPFEAFDDASGWDATTGDRVSPAEFQELYAAAEQVLGEALESSDVRLQAGMEKAAAGLNLSEQSRARVLALARVFAEADSSGLLEELTVAGFPANTLELDGSPMGDVPVGGYRELVAALAGGLDIRLGCAVTWVEADADRVRVGCEDGTELTASHVVITVPLGVLKAGSIDFRPALDPSRLRAVDRLGFGAFDKLVMRYDHSYWRDVEVRHLIFVPSERSAVPHGLLSLDGIVDQPTIMAFAFGSTHGWLAGRELEEVTAEAHAMLCAALGRRFPPPIEAVRSSWWRDPWTQGAYTYLKGDATYDDLETLGEPHAGRVLFAGEATGSARTGYVDGAILTAVREVKRLTGQDSALLTRLPRSNV
jgi:polyamine oxidase